LAGNIAEATDSKVFSLVTAIGSGSKSSIFYNRVKGELGDRKEFRLGEKFAELVNASISLLLVGGLKKYRPIQAREVDSKMMECANIEISDSQFRRIDFS
jgi:hypothetical protein